MGLYTFLPGTGLLKEPVTPSEQKITAPESSSLSLSRISSRPYCCRWLAGRRGVIAESRSGHERQRHDQYLEVIKLMMLDCGLLLAAHVVLLDDVCAVVAGR